ncbi:hypothetical protein SeMB42_g01608 [Synchytrium endobioticum]|uniref:Complex 1 LYR protein domain-containing protein n=1 Tax=Synchytrium endobioticum TaxID=286115 RepID=A0A507DLW6_9FUNG|nr:hypothetical protein SeLEV6574_g00583 [Synchytrium endobioticum]TPX52187.1 hypothetical protein SeMB42_g01610 [Synchytrium endobioticum]TPX52201.1 hypothetical protein SeMB42_g01605 [Synchytrium endobioticum]TPX52204.1 hypothetical protein SeMB42_g01608 [Synchytrium endobioticum]
MSTDARRRVLRLYKELLYVGQTYPAGFENYFRPKLRAAFKAKASLADPRDIERAINLGEYVYKEIEALHFLKKYRTMKQRYG